MLVLGGGGLLFSRGAGGGAVLAWEQPYRDNPCIPLPQTGASPTVGAPAPPAWSAWTQITAGEAAAYTLVQLCVAAVVLVGSRIFIQLGVGAAGAESVIYEVADRTEISGAGATPLTGYYYRLPPYRLAASTRLAFRVRQTASTANDVRLGVVVHAQASPLAGAQPFDGDAYAAGSASSLQLVTPAIPAILSVTAGTPANTYGAWREFIAAAATRLRPIAVHGSSSAAGGTVTNHFQVGTGAAGAETPHEIASVPGNGAFTIPHYPHFARPVDVLAGERVALRLRSTTAGQIRNVALIYETVPV